MSHRPPTDGAPRVLVASLPKSGTNLVASVLNLFPDFARQRLRLNRKLRLHPLNLVPSRQTCLIGVDQPRRVKVHTVRHALGKLEPNSFSTGHVPYSPALEDVIAALGIRVVIVLRDPRDVAVSQMFHVMKRESHFLHEHYLSLPSDKDRLAAAIVGVGPAERPVASGMGAKIACMWPWASRPDVHVSQFERLIGIQGGGTADGQRDEILQIAAHIGVELNANRASEIGAAAFGRGDNFRRGTIGQWQEHFDDELRALFKAEAASFLMEMGYEGDDQW